MKKVFLWIVMVLLFTALLVGGTIGLFYWKAGDTALPPPEVTYGEVSVGEPVGHQWDVPVLWGASERRFEESPSLSVHKLGTLDEARPMFGLPDWATGSELSIRDGSGAEVFSGSLEEYADFGFAANGEYTATLRLSRSTPGQRPATPQGWYQYCFRFTLSATPGIRLSKDSVPQGSVVGVELTGVLGSVPPVGESDLGTAWFCREGSSWVGYLPVAHNAETGLHTLTIQTDGGGTLTREVEVYQKTFDRVEVQEDEEPLTQAAIEEYRSKIWPLYRQGSLPKQWRDAFTQPVKGEVVRDYGAVLVSGDSVGRASDLVLKVEPGREVVMPSDGTIVFAGELQLGGQTVVIDHGCGLKTYISGLGAIYVQEGDTRLQTEAIGETGDEELVLEMRIGNKSISPWEAWRGNGGLFYP